MPKLSISKERRTILWRILNYSNAELLRRILATSDFDDEFNEDYYDDDDYSDSRINSGFEYDESVKELLSRLGDSWRIK